ncbi:unnamed protein product [Schistosoma mattheei]|uniref:Uncharacterized protein n=1 Tax=Schistosoma mattheei TaxID=31246 RepID=A0A183NVC0_9TREM|nr:unnamed protein product [Schistosoma mattheei]
MDFLTCASCMRNGICLPVTIVKCMVGNELIFCQNKEKIMLINRLYAMVQYDSSN